MGKTLSKAFWKRLRGRYWLPALAVFALLVGCGMEPTGDESARTEDLESAITAGDVYEPADLDLAADVDADSIQVLNEKTKKSPASTER